MFFSSSKICNYALRLSDSNQHPSNKGEQVEAFSAQSLRNQTISVNYSGNEVTRVLLYFTASCPYCSEQFTYWKQLLSKANGNHFQIIGVVSESEDRSKLEEYLKSFGCESLPVVILPKEISKKYKLSMTPTTLIIDNQGIIQEAWVGMWSTEDMAKVGSIFGLQFSRH